MANPTLDNLYDALIENGSNKPEVVMVLSALYGHERKNKDFVTQKTIDDIVKDFNPKSIYGLLDQNQLLLLMGDKMAGVREGGVIEGIQRDSESLLRNIYNNLIKPPAENDFEIPFGTILNNKTMNLVILSAYSTDAYQVNGGFPGVLTIGQTYPIGVLYFQGASNIPNPEAGFFGSVDKVTYERTAKKTRVVIPSKNSQLLETVLQEALQQLESNNPIFLYPKEACSPLPNFMRKEEWPKISKLIKDYLNESHQ